MAMTQAQIEEFNRIRAIQNDLAASDWAGKQGIPPSEYILIFEKYPVKNNPLAPPPTKDTTPKPATTSINKPEVATSPAATSKTTTPPAPKVTTTPVSTSVVSPIRSRPSSIPHPEEPMNPMVNLANIYANTIISQWLQDWGVPVQHWNYWRMAIDLQVYDNYPASLLAMGLTQDTPAAAWEANGKRYLAVKAKWLNPGVIAHEQAHNSNALLTPSQKAEFSAIYTPLKNTDYLIRLLYSKNRYGLTNDVEGHAEVYRYIGQYMPDQLKNYYPRLF